MPFSCSGCHNCTRMHTWVHLEMEAASVWPSFEWQLGHSLLLCLYTLYNELISMAQAVVVCLPIFWYSNHWTCINNNDSPHYGEKRCPLTVIYWVLCCTLQLWQIGVITYSQWSNACNRCNKPYTKIVGAYSLHHGEVIHWLWVHGLEWASWLM